MAGYGATTVLRPLEQPIDAPGPRYTTPSPRSLGSTSSTRRAIAFVSMLVGAGVVAMMVVHGGLGLADSSNMEQHSSDPKPLNALILGDSITASAGCQKGQQRCEACKNLKEDGGWVQIFEKLAPEMNIMSVGATGRGAIKPEHWEENKKCASPEAHHQSFWPKLADSLGHHYNGRPDVVFILFGTVRVPPGLSIDFSGRRAAWHCAPVVHLAKKASCGHCRTMSICLTLCTTPRVGRTTSKI